MISEIRKLVNSSDKRYLAEVRQDDSDAVSIGFLFLKHDDNEIRI